MGALAECFLIPLPTFVNPVHHGCEVILLLFETREEFTQVSEFIFHALATELLVQVPTRVCVA